MPVPAHPTPARAPRLLHLQILRALAASLVVAAHVDTLAGELGFDLSRYSHVCAIAGVLGVSTFFVLSGFIMFHQANGNFQIPGASLDFMSKRVIRIVPMYWLATFLTLAKHTYKQVGHLRLRIAFALFFIPDSFNIIGRPQPLLGPGWTLDYEVAFYLLVALALFLPQRRGVFVLIVVPVALTILGADHYFPLSGFVSSLLNV